MNQQSEIPDLPGIDMQAGLTVVRGNIELLTRLLLKFADSYADFEDQFRNAQQDSDAGAAQRSAHSLKGVSANLGATVLAQAARELEQACNEGPQQIDSKMTAVTSELQKVIAGVEILRQ